MKNKDVNINMKNNSNKIIKCFENFISNAEFLIENDWEDFIPETIKLERDGHKSTFKLRDSLKNMNSVDLMYYLEESTTQRTSNNLTINITFKSSNSYDTPMIDNTFETVVEIVVGTLYILGVKLTSDRMIEFIPRKGKIDSTSLNKISDLIEYISDGEIKRKI